MAAGQSAARGLTFWRELLGDRPLGEDRQRNAPKDDDRTTSAATGQRRREPCDALFLFDSNEISAQVSAGYGSYAQGEILKALSAARAPEGGWGSFISGCDGDLFEPQILVSWLRDAKYNIDASLVQDKILHPLQARQRLSTILYVVGLGPPERRHVLDMHTRLQESQTVGYLGVFILEAELIPLIAGELGIMAEMMIRNTECTGWLASHEILRQVGLYEGKPKPLR
jgi:hypothetical protein